MSSPNILFIHAESMDGRKMGCMGHPALKNATPHLDRLAEEGVLFTNAYTNCPVCNPSRASMWSGKYPNYRDCWNNHEGLREGVRTYQDTFNSAGYQTSAVGPIDYAYGKHSMRDRIGSWTRAAHIKRPMCRTPLPAVVDDGQAHQRDWRHTYRAIEDLHTYSDSNRPFWLYLTTGLVHPAFVSEKRYMSRIDEREIDMPTTLMGLEATRNEAVAYQRITKNCDKKFSENLVREMRHVYFAMIAAFDDMVGRVLTTLDELGLADNTYVIFSSDHGEMAGEQNQVLKRNMYEPSAHVPLIVRGPEVQRGSVVETPVSLVDLYPTFLDMANLDYGAYARQPGYAASLDGESLMPQLVDHQPRKRPWAMCEYHGDRAATGTFMLRQDEWKYIKHVGYQPELFNLEQDPGEAHDLAQEEPDTVQKLEGILTENFDCEGIDARAKQYDRENFVAYRERAKADGTYADMMARVYSGFDRLSIEDIARWTDGNEQRIEAWLNP
ncbi:MAG: sulfatase-like hydrolase/transferase [bacterium]|nr:sulfatase-like hydrolase/transferase [bacterium]